MALDRPYGQTATGEYCQTFVAQECRNNMAKDVDVDCRRDSRPRKTKELKDSIINYFKIVQNKALCFLYTGRLHKQNACTKSGHFISIVIILLKTQTDGKRSDS